MLVNVTDKSDNTLVNENDIKYRREHSYIYGLSLEYYVGTSFEVDTVEVSKKYMLTFNDKEASEFVLYSVKAELVGDETYYIMRFVKSIFADIHNNTIPNEKSLFSISFKNYVKYANNQFDFLFLELRKKSLCLVNDDTDEPTQKHINELLFSSPKEDTSIVVARELNDYQLKFKNYYTITDKQEIITTKNGKDLPIFLPFLTKEDILGLDNYLLPCYELTTDLTKLKIGDILKLPNENIVIIEKDELAFFGTVTTYLVGARASKQE